MANSKTIVFLLVGVVLFGLLVCGGGAGIWYFKYYRAGVAPDVGPMAGQALALPADTVVAGGLDVKALVASAGYKQVASGDVPGLEKSMTPKQVAEMKKQTREGIEKGLKEAEDKIGIRLDRDVDRIVVAGSSIAADKPEMALIALGRFDRAKVTRAVEASAKAENATVTSKTVEGVPVEVMSEPGKPGAELAVLDDTTLVAGTPGAVDAVVASHAKRARPLETNASLLGLVKGLDPASGYWVVLDQPLIARLQKEAGATPPVPLPKNLTLAGKYDGGMELAGEMADDAAAKNVVDMIEGGLGMVRMQAAQSPEVQKTPGAKELLDGIKVKAEGKRVRITVPASGGGTTLGGVIAADALPGLMRAHPALGAGAPQSADPTSGADTAAPPETTAAAPEPPAAAPQTQAPAPVRVPQPARTTAPARAPAPKPALRQTPDTLPPPPTPTQPIRVGGQVREPRKIRNVDPVYPEVAKRARVQGIVIMEATIGPEGRVTDVRVLRSIPMLDDAALAAVRQWVYEPTLLNGVPVPVLMTVTANFKLR